jgi:hypothetical protein
MRTRDACPAAPPRVSCGPSAVVLDLARYRTYLAGRAPSPLVVRVRPRGDGWPDDVSDLDLLIMAVVRTGKRAPRGTYWGDGKISFAHA